MIGDLSAKDILLKFYDEDSDLFRLLWKHSCQVAEMSLDIASRLKGVDEDFVYDAALLHDVGIIKTNAPKIFCNGTEPYIRHGILGAEMLRSLGDGMDRYARVCECHTGAGLSKDDIERGNLPLPHRDMVPETVEEKIVCYADKFYSKSNVNDVKTVDYIRADLGKFGEGQLRRFDEMNALFNR